MIHFISLEIEQLESKRKKKEPKKSLQIMYCKGYEYLSHEEIYLLSIYTLFVNNNYFY